MESFLIVLVTVVAVYLLVWAVKEAKPIPENIKWIITVFIILAGAFYLIDRFLI